MSSLELWFELQSLEVEYWYDVDMNWGRSAHTFYVEDGEFSIGDKKFSGAAEVANFYAWRASLGKRTARHVVTNFRVSNIGDDRARFECVLLLYAENGEPVLESKPAIMIADITNEYIRTDGAWKLQSRVLRPLFEGGAAATVPK
jgi:hypothetical protein